MKTYLPHVKYSIDCTCLLATVLNSPFLRFAILLCVLCFAPTHAGFAREARIGTSLAIFANVQKSDKSSGSDLEYLPRHQDEIRECLEFLRVHRIKHIRLIVNPVPLMSSDRTVSHDAFSSVLDFVKLVNRRNIGVTIDFHTWPPLDPAGQTYQIMANQTLRHRYTQAILTMSASLSKNQFGQNSLELMNEPSCKSANWPEFQIQLYKAVREQSKKLKLVITGCGGAVETLTHLDVSSFGEDKNLLYSFHFYEPFIFTHQQTYFGAHLKSIPFPPDALTVQGKLRIEKDNKDNRSDEEYSYRDELRHYLKMDEGDKYIIERFRSVSEWAKVHNIDRQQIYVGEFGMNIPVLDDDIKRVRPDIIHWMKVTAETIAAEGFSASTWPPISRISEPHRSRFDLIHGDKIVISALGWR